MTGRRTETAAPQEQSRTGGYIPQIDGMRAVAIIAVMIYHLAPWMLPGGFAGVDVFFVISGYVVSASLARDTGRPFGQFLSRFYARRMVRIIPPLLACLVLTSVAATLFIPDAWLSNTSQFTALFAFVGLGNAAMVWLADGYFSPRVEFNPYVHTWSLGVEEQFYLIFPLVFLAWAALRHRAGAIRHAGTWLLGAILVLSLAYAWQHIDRNPERAFYLLPGRLWELASGALIFQLQHRAPFGPRSTAGSNALLWLGAASVVAGVFLSREHGYPFPWALAAVGGSMLLIVGITAPATPNSVLASVLGSTAFVTIGKLSYSLYLWHWPVNVLHRWTVGLDGPVHAASATALTALLASASYHFLEKPIRGHPAIRSAPPWRVITAGAASVVLCIGAAVSVFSSQRRISVSVTADRDSWYPNAPDIPREPPQVTCRAEAGAEQSNRIEVRTITPAGCEQNARRPQRLFVIGDSHAIAYAAMLTRLTEELGVAVHIYSNGGCSFANMHKASSGYWMECVRYYEAAAASISDAAAPGDVVFLAGLRLNRLGDQWGAVTAAGGATTPNSAEAIRQRTDALAETADLVGAFAQRGVHIIIDAPAPIFRAAAYRCSDWYNRGNSYCTGGLTASREFLQTMRQPVVDSLTSLAARVPRTKVWDPFPSLCPDDVCTAADQRGPLYFDGDHISGTGNNVVYPSFASLLKRTWNLDK